jgi:hypothetical protein
MKRARAAGFPAKLRFDSFIRILADTSHPENKPDAFLNLLQ